MPIAQFEIPMFPISQAQLHKLDIGCLAEIALVPPKAVGLFAVANSAVIAVRIVGNVESGKPPTAAPVQV